MPATVPEPPALRAQTNRAFAAIVASFGDDDEAAAFARRRMLELIDGTGVMGTTPTRLMAGLEVEGIAPTRESLDRWLEEEEMAGRVRRASHGRWKSA